jgi:hypothetical protein
MFLQNVCNCTVLLTEGSMFLQNICNRTLLLTEGSMFLHNVGNRTVMLSEGSMFLHNVCNRTIMLSEGSNVGNRPFDNNVSQSVWNLWWEKWQWSGFSPRTSISPVGIIPPMLHTHSYNRDATESENGSIIKPHTHTHTHTHTQCHNPEGHKSKFLAASRHAKQNRIKGCFALVYLHEAASGLSHLLLSQWQSVISRAQHIQCAVRKKDNHNGSPPKQMKVWSVSVSDCRSYRTGMIHQKLCTWLHIVS